MIADTSTAAGSRDEVAELAKPSVPNQDDRPNHIAAVILGAISLIVAVPTGVVNIVFWTDGHGREVTPMLNMQLTAIFVGCFIGAAAAWWGANVVHRLAHVEAVEHRIEAREVILRDELNQRLDAMEHNLVQKMVELGEKMTEVKRQSWYSGYGSGYEDRGLHDSGKPPGTVVPMPKRLAPRPLDLQA